MATLARTALRITRPAEDRPVTDGRDAVPQLALPLGASAHPGDPTAFHGCENGCHRPLARRPACRPQPPDRQSLRVSGGVWVPIIRFRRVMPRPVTDAVPGASVGSRFVIAT